LGKHTGIPERNVNFGKAYWRVSKKCKGFAGILAHLKGILMLDRNAFMK
jgi:hypothetical protein